MKLNCISEIHPVHFYRKTARNTPKFVGIASSFEVFLHLIELSEIAKEASRR